MSSTLPNLAIFQAIAKHDPTSTAVVHSESNQQFSYGSLLRDTIIRKEQISQNVSGAPLQGKRIAFLAENSYEYVGVWRLGDLRTMLTLNK